ncbi:glutamine-hydrolyzing carbamoyl-phosphate synthase small subunit [Clostridium perfringens]|uniref:glutamine-hydrolyzing carbamoyl-phosphate synthase small subunit n=1 Tax=Clostridium perfringens TaxID=1502 RepID=UPI0013E325D1|nr:glutamine-hydrolyzing carbamoyl-phosphate synthase small subunit [Clostridium perfringens]ELC8454052.1 glutamine-hydrolyzing carbamoyl-phosphate synthase small subunit [Clostridium perfringens]MDM0931277.1 glutamine-hydrolyzing carbamoyl-phosphate synthase small subunit [Clostridium perfringens]MDM0983525.1 glutamine-hydrolyzing carbamoyl-phosphate synthase small subunit [Clostridium perfringens]NGT06765.1 glutamine-hydrolyzing carbamoyl-phosphate synthase small subunit [Clostridium perfring
MKAKLILENGVVFEGKAFGYLKECVGEVVFNTGMTGYQEVLTDPSYYGQIVTMTYPLIGNYGINLEDLESKEPKVRGFIVREKCQYPNNFRCELELETYLAQNKVLGLDGIDTRALTKILRNNGTMKGIIVLDNSNLEDVKDKLEAFSNRDAVSIVSTNEKYEISGEGKKVAIIDFGIKQNIIRNFVKRGCNVTVFPYDFKAEEVLEINPDLVFLSNGPGDPEDMGEAVNEVKKIVGKKPIVGICLGHQLLALTLGGETKKLKFGHRGCNHPVKDLINNRVHITSQNHGYYVATLPENMEITHVSMNDGTVEGMKHKELPIFSVQFHPEACPGPKDSEYIFDEFMKYAL